MSSWRWQIKTSKAGHSMLHKHGENQVWERSTSCWPSGKCSLHEHEDKVKQGESENHMGTLFKVVSRRNYYTMCDRVVIGVAKTLEEAAKLRRVSGDLVTLHGLVVDSEEWLFPWEKTDPNCYAKKAIEADREAKNYKYYKLSSSRTKLWKKDERHWRLAYDREMGELSHQWVYPNL